MLCTKCQSFSLNFKNADQTSVEKNIKLLTPEVTNFHSNLIPYFTHYWVRTFTKPKHTCSLIFN